MRVLDDKTGLVFQFKTHKEKESFFDLWDKYEIYTQVCIN